MRAMRSVLNPVRQLRKTDIVTNIEWTQKCIRLVPKPEKVRNKDGGEVLHVERREAERGSVIERQRWCLET